MAENDDTAAGTGLCPVREKRLKFGHWGLELITSIKTAISRLETIMKPEKTAISRLLTGSNRVTTARYVAIVGRLDA